MVCFLKAVLVSWKDSPSGRDLNQTWPALLEFPKPPGPRRNATSLPSRDSAGISAESSKFVSCSQRRAGTSELSLRVRRGHNNKVAAIKAQTAAPPIVGTSHRRGRFRSGAATVTAGVVVSTRRRSPTNSFVELHQLSTAPSTD